MNIIILSYNNYGPFKGHNLPCLFKANKKDTVLEKQIKIIGTVFQKPKINIITGLKHNKVTDVISNINNINVIENNRYQETNCLYNIRLALNSGAPLLIMPANIIFHHSIFKNIDYTKSQIWITKTPQEIGCTINKFKIEHMMFGLPIYWSNICLITGKELILLKQLLESSINTNKWFLYEALNWIIEKGGQIYPIYKNAKITTINKLVDI